MPPIDAAPPTDGRIRVLVIDADDRVRLSLAGLLAIGDVVIVVGSAGQVGAGLDVARETQPDIVIVDPRLPDLAAGTAFVARLRTLVPGVRVVAMGWSDDLERPGVDCGADGSMRKTFRPADLLAAILAVGRPALT